MARIPDFTALGPAPTPEPARSMFPIKDDSGAMIAQAGDELDQSLTRVSDDVYQLQQRNAVTAASNALSNFRLQQDQSFQSQQQRVQGDPTGFTPRVLGNFDKDAGTLVKGFQTDPLAQQYLGRALPMLRTDLGQRALQWESSQAVAWRENSVLDNTDKLSALVQSDPSQQVDITAQLSHQIAASGLPPDQQALMQRHVQDTIGTAAGQGLAKQDPASFLARFSDPNDALLTSLSPDRRAGLQEFTQGQLVSQRATAIAQVYRDAGVEPGTRALAALQADQSIPANLRDQIGAHVDEQLEQLRAQRLQQFAPQLAQLEQNIVAGKAGDADRASAWNMYNQGALDPAQLATSLSSIDRSQIRGAREDVAIAAVENAYTNGTPLDPKDDSGAGPASARGAADLYFTKVLAAGQQPGSPGYANAAVQLATKTGIVPDSAISWARANLTSGDAQAAAQGADLISRLEEGSPRALGFALDDRTKAMADSINQAVKAGAPAPLAVEQARQLATLSSTQLTELKQKWLATKPQLNQGSALTDLLKADPGFKPGILSSMPTVPPAMQAEFDASTQRYFDLTGGNVGQARQLAVRDLKRVWGTSQVNGQRQIMPYAPETMYPGLSATDVRTDVASTVQANAQALRQYDPETGALKQISPAADTIRLIPTDRTARTNGLEWQLGAPDQWGAMDVVRGADGNPLVYRLPVDQVDFNRVRTEQAQAALTKARQLQAQRQESLALAQREEEQSLAVLGR